MRVVLAAAGLAGLLAGAAATMALQEPPVAVTAAPTTTTSTTVPLAAPVPDPPEGVVLVWTPGSLPEDLAGAVAGLEVVEAVTEVRGGLLHMVGSRDASGTEVDRAPEGFVIPLEAVGVDPDTYPGFLPESARATLAGLRPGEVVLGSTSARLRRLGEGGVLELEDGSRHTVVAILEDTLVGAAEVLTAHPDGLGVGVPRYLLVRYTGDRVALEATIRDLLPAGVQARIRGPGETPYFRYGDAVLPQAHVKAAFGEFAYRPGPGRSFHQDPVWVEANIVTASLPILGRETCHRSFLPALRGALEELETRGLGHLVRSSAGCWNPRSIGPDRGISRHAWGAAIDLNYTENPTGTGSAQDPRLVEAMERWGLGWGGFWLVPDPAHFEYLGPPRP